MCVTRPSELRALGLELPFHPCCFPPGTLCICWVVRPRQGQAFKKEKEATKAKVLKMFLQCKSCLNNITKFEAKWTTPVVWADIQF